MPRHARLSVPLVPWHIIQRSNMRSAYLVGEEGRRRDLETLKTGQIYVVSGGDRVSGPSRYRGHSEK